MDLSGDDNAMTAEEFLHYSCSLCMESFQGRKPKLLPCFHTFCLPCLVTLADKSSREEQEGKSKTQSHDESGEDETDDTDERVDDKKGSVGDEEKAEDGDRNQFPCPTCRAPVTIPKGGVSALQTNFYVDTGVSLADKGPQLCETCEEGEQEQAQHFCNNCQQRLCRTCKRLHDLFAKGHRMEALPEPSRLAGKAGEGKKGGRLCTFHPDQPLCFHCCQCDTTICLHCKLTSHEGHDTQDMATATLKARGQLPALQTQANTQLQLLAASIRRLERDQQDLSRQKQEVMRQVTSTYDVLIDYATRARDELLEEVAAQEQACLNEMQATKASAEFHRGNIAGKNARASRSVNLGEEVVLGKNELQAALMKDEWLQEYRELANRTERLTFFNTTAEPSVLDLSTLRAYFGKLTDSPPDDCEVAPPLSFRELASAVTYHSKLLDYPATDSGNVPTLTFPELEAELKSLKDELSKTAKVSFQAVSNNNCAASPGQKIVFNTAHCNDGDGYDSSTGIFSAPAEGTYSFSTTMQHYIAGQWADAALMVKGTQWASASSCYSCSCSCVVSLNKGDQVWVQPASHAFNCMANSTMFSGALLCH